MLKRFIPVLGGWSLLVLGGCQSDGPGGARGGGTGGAPMTSSGELAVPHPKPMDAQTQFFGGGIQVEAMLAKSDAEWKNPSRAEANREGGRRGGGGFGGGLGGGAGGQRRGGGGGEGRRAGGGGETPPPGASADAPRGPVMRASNAPPVQLRLRLTNHGEQPVDVEVLDFNSELGNFVVQPKSLAISVGESAEAEPMTSRLGVPAVEEIPITVRLRVGGKAGRIETQVLKLRPRSEAPPPVDQKNS